MSVAGEPQETDLSYAFQLDDETRQGLEVFSAGLESPYNMRTILMGNFMQLLYEICKESHVTLLDGNDLSSCYRWDMAQIQTYEELFEAFQNRSSYRTVAMNLGRQAFDVEDDFGHILFDAGNRGKLVQDAVDLNRHDGHARQGR